MTWSCDAEGHHIIFSSSSSCSNGDYEDDDDDISDGDGDMIVNVVINYEFEEVSSS